MVSPSNVDSLVLNTTVTYSFPGGSSAPSPPLPHVSDDSFVSDPIPPDILGVFSLPWLLFTRQRFGIRFYCGMAGISLHTKVQGQR